MFTVSVKSLTLNAVDGIPDNLPQGIEVKEVEIGFIDKLLETLNKLSDKIPGVSPVLSSLIIGAVKNKFLDVSYSVDFMFSGGTTSLTGRTYLHVN